MLTAIFCINVEFNIFPNQFCLIQWIIFRAYPRLTLQKSNAVLRYDTDFSVRYFAYRRTNGDIS